MKRTVLSLLLFIICIVAQAQIKFEKGYFINNQGVKTECFIKNEDWRNNPVKFEYRITENSKTEYGSIKLIREFSVLGVCKYIKKDVDVDLSSNVVRDLSSKKHPEFKRKVLFLKKLTSGTSTLYKYSVSGVSRYFFSIGDDDVKQLIYKKYLNAQNKIGVNEGYKQQLFTNVNCGNWPIQKYLTIKYHEADMVKYFKRFNECSGDVAVDELENIKRDWFNLRVKSGVSFSSLNVDQDRDKFNFDKKSSVRFGVELGVVLPFKRNKWEVYLEPTYQSYNTSGEFNDYSPFSNNVYNIEVSYKSIELPLGVKHRFFIKDELNVFVNVGYYFDFVLDSKMEYKTGKIIEVTSTNNLLAGIGVELFNKLSIEYKVFGDRDLFSNHVNYKSKYHTSSIMIGYKLF